LIVDSCVIFILRNSEAVILTALPATTSGCVLTDEH
jgi:hypothetical protein